MKKQGQRAMTLLEIMIVIFLIGLIGSVVGYNLKGSIDEGRAFKTRQAQERLRDILLLETSKDSQLTPEKILENPAYYVKKSSLVRDVNDLLKDGWGSPFSIKLTRDRKDFSITSENLNQYVKKQESSAKKDSSSKPEEDEE